MSVSVKNLTKMYGDQPAVDNISFETRPGEVLGFLGPNGAGKSTTMKMITCFVPQSSGSASVCGHDINGESMAVRKKVGYLPENNPLYLDMYVKEYLAFVGKVHHMKDIQKRVTEMIVTTGLEREQHKKIRQLSKGYRQRVGLAQAMFHDPEVLILDEPTSGLDPNQLTEIRALIKKMGEKKTVILSTHIMQEVQAICDRVVIINKGKIVADDPTDMLQERIAGETVVMAEFAEKVSAEQLRSINGVTRAVPLKNNAWQLYSGAGKDIRAEVSRFARENNLTLLTLGREKQNLEAIFRKLTGNE